MENIILTEPQEVIGDQIARVFYEPPSGPLTPQINEALTGQAPDAAQAILNATISRLYSEQAVRRRYLAGFFSLTNLSRDELDDKLLSLSASSNPGITDANAISQLRYFGTVSLNLTSYAAEEWAKENQLLFGVLVKLPTEALDALIQSLSSYTTTFYQNGVYENLTQIAVPKSVTAAMTSAGILVELSRYETIIEKTAFLVFLQQSCELVREMRVTGLTDRDQILRGISLATVRFQSVLTKTA